MGRFRHADATCILPRVVTATDFVRYNGVTGFTPYTGYATDFTTPGTNVSVTAATAVAIFGEYQRAETRTLAPSPSRSEAVRPLGSSQEWS